MKQILLQKFILVQLQLKYLIGTANIVFFCALTANISHSMFFIFEEIIFFEASKTLHFSKSFKCLQTMGNLKM